MPRIDVRELRSTTVAIATFLIRPSIFLILGLAIGYGVGFTDAFRDSDTLGNKVARVVYRVHPASLSEGIRIRATTIRDTVHSRTGLNDMLPPN